MFGFLMMCVLTCSCYVPKLKFLSGSAEILYFVGYTDDKMIGASPEKTQPNPAKRPRLN